MICPTGLLHPSNAPHFKTFKLFLIYFLRSSVIFFSIYAHKHRNTRVHCKFPAPIGTHRQSDSVHHALCGPGCFYTISQVPDAVMTERSSTSQLTPGSSFHFTFFSFFSSLKCWKSRTQPLAWYCWRPDDSKCQPGLWNLAHKQERYYQLPIYIETKIILYHSRWFNMFNFMDPCISLRTTTRPTRVLR